MPTTSTLEAELKATLNTATRLNRAHRYREVIDLLLPLSRTHPDSGPVQGVLAGAYFEAGDYRQASRFFRAATVAAPTSELASLGLFHSLWETGSKSKAFAEMTRFLSLRESDEYATLLRDMAVEGLLTARREPAGHV